MKTTIITIFFLLGIYSSAAFELQHGVYKLLFAGSTCTPYELAKFEFTPLEGSCSDINTTSCVTEGPYSSYSRSCGPPPQQLFLFPGFPENTWVVLIKAANGTNCTDVLSAVGTRIYAQFRSSTTTGYMWTCSNTSRTRYSYDGCSPTSCSGSGGFVLNYPNSIGKCRSSGQIDLCDKLSYDQEPSSPVATSPENSPVAVPVAVPVAAPQSLPSPAAQSPNNNNVAPLADNTVDGVPVWAVTLLIVGAVVIVALIVAMVALHIRHKRNLYTRIHDEGELPVNRLLRG